MKFDKQSFLNYLAKTPEKYIWYTTSGLTYHLIKAYMFQNFIPENTRSILPDVNNFSVMPDNLVNREFYSLGTTSEAIWRLCIGDLKSHLEQQKIVDLINETVD